MPETIYALSNATTNAELIENCAKLGWLNRSDLIVDGTYGLGNFWTRWSPERLIGLDIDPKRAKDICCDFRSTPFEDASVDVYVLDPAFKENGQGGSHPSDVAYGVADRWQGVGGRMHMLNEGIVEGARILKPGGRLLVKVMDQVVSAGLSWQTKEAWLFATSLGFTQVDELILRSNTGQPRRGTCAGCDRKVMMRSDGMWGWVSKGTPDPWLAVRQRTCTDGRRHLAVVEDPQEHGRRNYSTLLVFEFTGAPDPQPVVEVETEPELEGEGVAFFVPEPPAPEPPPIDRREVGNGVLYVGDCRDQLRDLPDNSVDAVVTDPPYGLSKEPDMAEVLRHWLNGDDYAHRDGGFMDISWDSFVPGPATWREVLRVLKPGGHALVFAGSRTQDLMGTSLRLAGFEIRDGLQWLYGSGWPKGQNIYRNVAPCRSIESAPHAVLLSAFHHPSMPTAVVALGSSTGATSTTNET